MLSLDQEHSFDWTSYDIFPLSPCKIWSARQAAGTHEHMIMYLRFPTFTIYSPFYYFSPLGSHIFWKILSTKQTTFIKE